MKYFRFGMNTLRVTQNWKGNTSHLYHWYHSTDYADYPIDVAGENGGRDTYYATVDMKVTSIFGIGKGYTNTIWLETVEQVQTPSGIMKVFISLAHFNDNDIYVSKLKVGDIIKAGNPICMEGTDGTTANHLHMICGNADRGSGNKLIQNSNGKWVSNGYCMKPEEIFYIDSDFTKVVSDGDISFKKIPIIDDKASFFGSNGYFQLGNYHENIGKICYFFAEYFYGYFYSGSDAKERAHEVLDGNYFGPYLKKWTIEFQKRAKIEGNYDDNIDGCIGPKTLEALKKYGFVE